MRAWPLLALSGLTVLLLSLGALWAGPSFMRMCDGSVTGIGTGDAVAMCGRMIEGARFAALVGGFLLLGGVALGVLSVAGSRPRARDSGPLVSVRARRR